MCGRYARTQGADDIFSAFDLQSNELDNSLPLNWNIAPTNEIYIIRGERALASASWGLIAPWMSDIAAARTRCIIPVNGYYEWATALGKYPPKQPFYISPDPKISSRAFAVAGIWSRWINPNGEIIDSASIITREAVGDLATIHSRMPVMLPEDRWDSWLDSTLRDPEEALEMLRVDRPDHGLIAHPVSSRVNLVANNGEDLITPIDLGEPTTLF